MAYSRELSGAVALGGLLATVAIMGSTTADRLAFQLRRSLFAATSEGLDPLSAIRESLYTTAVGLSWFCSAALLAGGFTAMFQVGGLRFSPPAIAIDLRRLDPAQGLRRICSSTQLRSVFLGIAKATLAGSLTWHWLLGSGSALSRLPQLRPQTAAPAIYELLLPLVGQLCFALALLGLLDLFWAHRLHLRALRMTREEVRRDYREQEGDPHHKAERQRRHRALAAARPVAKATCVVVNPLHLAVALWHQRGSEEAPVVLAKGRGRPAAWIRSQARCAGVPIVRDVALARALYRLAEVGEEIPEELYQAAALVLVHVYGTASRESSP